MRIPSVFYHNYRESRLLLAHSSRQSGFTLIEVMIVMTIIGILAIIGVVSYQTKVRKTNLMTIYQEINKFRLPYQTLRLSYQTLIGGGTGVTNFSPSGLNMSESSKYCIFSVIAPMTDRNTVNAVVCDIQNLSYLDDQSLSLTFNVNTNWDCIASSGINKAYLPKACR